MFRNILRYLGVITAGLLALALAGCATTTVKHLSSDVCLVMPESTTKPEVLSFLGEPAKKVTTPEGEETWVYYKEDKDTLRKLPLIGERLGTDNFETVTITFVGNKVRTCIYRQLTPGEFTTFNHDHQIEITE